MSDQQLYKKLTKDMSTEFERTASSYQKKKLLYEKRVQESRMVVLLMERKLHKLRKENDHPGKRWLNSSPSSQVGLMLPLLHLQPTEAQKEQGVPWVPRREKGHAESTLEPRATCRFGSTSQQPGPGHPQPQQNTCLCFLP